MKITTLSSVPGSLNGTGEGRLFGIGFGESEAGNSSLGGEGCEFGGCFGDSKIEHNFLTLPLRELPAETIEPKGEL